MDLIIRRNPDRLVRFALIISKRCGLVQLGNHKLWLWRYR
jgi:hypothetical protein